MVQAHRFLNPLIVIAGPTAAGKTALGIELARRIDGEIVSADSMQIYREMSIGTAKPTAGERAAVPHCLIDLVSCNEPFTVADYVTAAITAIDEIESRGKRPIVVGGTGLYLRALLEGYSLGGAGEDPASRDRYREIAALDGSEALHRLLEERAPERAAKIHRNDMVRLIRALELIDSGKMSIQRNEPIPHFLFVLNGDRDRLYARIDARAERMLDAGLVEEVRELLLQGIDPECRAMRAIGYREALAYVRGECGFEEMKETLKRNSRRYAKRQLTFFRHMESPIWLDFESSTAFMCDRIQQIIGE